MQHSTHDYDTETHRRALTDALLPLERMRIRPLELDFTNDRIGDGGFGEVLLALWRENGLGTADDQVNSSYVAVKRLRQQQHSFVRLALRFTRELKLWSTFQHPNILACLGFEIDLVRNEAYFVSPYLRRGSIRSHLKGNPRTSVEQRKKWVVDMTKGLAYLHSLTPPVVHGDLKSENILVHDENFAVLCDFGLSSVMEDSMSTGLTTSDGFKGSLRWCSPELMEGENRTPESDMWAWALCVLEITTGRLPFYDAGSEVAVVKRIIGNRYPTREQYPELPSNSWIWESLERCLQEDPKARLTAPDCLARLSIPPPYSTLYTIKTWSDQGTVIRDISPSGRLVVVSYQSTDKKPSHLTIENLETGDAMRIQTFTKYYTILLDFGSGLSTFSDDELYWAGYDDVVGTLHIYDIQGPAARLVASVRDPQHPSGQRTMIHFIKSHVLLFHSSEADNQLCRVSSVPATDGTVWIQRSVPEAIKQKVGSISPDSQYITLHNTSSTVNSANVYTISSIQSFLRDTDTAFPEPMATPTHYSSAAGFWIDDTLYAQAEDEQELCITDVVHGITRKLHIPKLDYRRTDGYRRGVFLNRLATSTSWLVYGGVQEDPLFKRFYPGAALMRTKNILHYFHVPTILALSNEFDWNSLQPPWADSGVAPNIMEELPCKTGAWPGVKAIASDVFILTNWEGNLQYFTAKRINKPSSWQ